MILRAKERWQDPKYQRNWALGMLRYLKREFPDLYAKVWREE